MVHGTDACCITIAVKQYVEVQYLIPSSEEAVRLRVLVADRMLQLLAQVGGSDAKLVLLLRQLADRFTRMKPANPDCRLMICDLS